MKFLTQWFYTGKLHGVQDMQNQMLVCEYMENTCQKGSIASTDTALHCPRVFNIGMTVTFWEKIETICINVIFETKFAF